MITSIQGSMIPSIQDYTYPRYFRGGGQSLDGDTCLGFVIL